MNWLDRVIAAVAPGAGLRRARQRLACEALANYDAATVNRRSGSVRPVAGDADAVADSRWRIALAVRDVVRNNPLAERALQVIVNAVVGTGIEAKLAGADGKVPDALKPGWARVKALFGSTQIDADGVQNLAGLLRSAVRAMVQDGEVFVLLPDEPGPSRLMQLRLLESEYLNQSLNLRAADSDNVIWEGIEYGPDGRVVAYHLYDDHPGSSVWHAGRSRATWRRVEARFVIHLYRVDRPGQRRGVSWFAPVLDDLVAIDDNDEAQLTRQKIAACFAAFWRSEKPGGVAGAEGLDGIPPTLSPGLIQKIGADDEVTFANPPDVTGYDDFARVHLRRVAAGLGITYEALTGDLGSVNFSSGRLGRIEMSQNVEAWQWTLVIPRLCDRIAEWLRQSWMMAEPGVWPDLVAASINWTPPIPVIAEPRLETQVSIMQIEAGLTSRHAEIRKLGYDPAEIDAEIAADAETRIRLALIKAAATGATVTEPDHPETESENDADA